jgi:hypothetical protein
MFPGDDYLNIIQTEANNLVDSILEESVTIINNKSSSYCPSSLMQEQQNEDQNQNLKDNFDIKPEQQQSTTPQLPLININHYNINPSDQYLVQSDQEISESYAIKSDCDIIVKSPTIESMSGKSFDDDFNTSNAFYNDSYNISNNLNNTATNIPTATTEYSIPSTSSAISAETSNTSYIVSSTATTTTTILEDPRSMLLSEHENEAIVRNLSESKLRHIERKFEHLSSQLENENDSENCADPNEDVDIDQIDNLVNKDDISQLQNEFSKISWDESLSATTGDFGSSTPDNDLHDVLTNPGDTQ